MTKLVATFTLLSVMGCGVAPNGASGAGAVADEDIGVLSQALGHSSGETIELGGDARIRLLDLRGSSYFPATLFKAELNALLNAALPETLVRMSTYDWDNHWNGAVSTWFFHDDTRTFGPVCWPEMHRAAMRGVEFRGVINTHPTPDVKRWLRGDVQCAPCRDNILGFCAPMEPHDFDLRECDSGASDGVFGACLGSHNMHAKLFTVEHAQASSDITVVSGHNHDYDGMRIHNHAVIIEGDAAIHDGTARFIDAMNEGARKQCPVSPADSYAETVSGDVLTTLNAEGTSRPVAKAYFWPRCGENFWESVLNRVDCSGGGELKITMGIARKSPRPMAVARKLASLAEAGCEVTMIGGAPGPVQQDFVKALGSKVDWVRASPGSFTPIHNKTVMINARYDGSAVRRRLVFTGSANFSNPALDSTNEEAMLRLEHDDVYHWFDHSFEDIFDNVTFPGNWADGCFEWITWGINWGRVCTALEPDPPE